jgi:hypothetical protein
MFKMLAMLCLLAIATYTLSYVVGVAIGVGIALIC